MEQCMLIMLSSIAIYCLLLLFGLMTGKFEAFASQAKIVHINIDSTEIEKNKSPQVSVCCDV